MKNKEHKEESDFSKLRLNAEKFLYEHVPDEKPLPQKDIKILFQELQVHQIELEMQNDELQLTNEELERQRFRFSGIYDFAPVGYLILDESGLIKEVNNTGMSLLEGTKTDISGKRLQTFVSPEDYDEYYKFFMRMLRTHSRQRCELNICTIQGKKINAQVEGVALNSTEGKIECYIAIIDISERIRTERELAETKERLILSLEASHAGAWELNSKNMRFFIGESAQKICNMSQGNFHWDYTDFINLIYPDNREEADRQFRICLNQRKEINLICRFLKPDEQECYMLIRGHSLSLQKSDHHIVGIIMDITEKMLMQRNSRLLQMENQKKVVLATLFTEENERKRISGALHDSVSQLLYAVKIKLGQLDKNKLDTAEIQCMKKLLDEAIEETRNISFELAPSILTDFGLSATIEELVRRLSSKNMKITAHVKGFFKRLDLLLETNIYRIVQELLNNCIRHSDGTEINIEVHNKKQIDIMIRDNGKGFNVKELESKMTSSGLSSIRNRISLYNGTLHIKSEPGKGTAVHVILHNNDKVTKLN